MKYSLQKIILIIVTLIFVQSSLAFAKDQKSIPKDKMIDIVQFFLLTARNDYSKETFDGIVRFYANIYAETFTESELKKLVALAQSKAGQKLFKDLKTGILSNDISEDDRQVYKNFFHSTLGQKYFSLTDKALDKIEKKHEYLRKSKF